MKTLQFVFCILACFCVAATTMVGLLWDLMYALIPAFFAVVFAALMFLVKKKRTPVEKKARLHGSLPRRARTAGRRRPDKVTVIYYI